MTGTRKNGWVGEYIVYRQIDVIIDDDDDQIVAAALVLCGKEKAQGPKQALAAWFDSLPYDEKVKLDGTGKFIVVPSSNHHQLQPKVQAQPRLVF